MGECAAYGNPQMTFVLVGNKTDLETQRRVSTEVAVQFASNHDMLFFETSAKSADGVDRLFTEAAELVFRKVTNGTIDPKIEAFGVKVGASWSSGENFLTHVPLNSHTKRTCC